MNLLLVVLLALVGAVLLAGLAVMGVGGKTNRKYSNRLMMVRVAVQGVIVLVLGLMFAIK